MRSVRDKGFNIRISIIQICCLSVVLGCSPDSSDPVSCTMISDVCDLLGVVVYEDGTLPEYRCGSVNFLGDIAEDEFEVAEADMSTRLEEAEWLYMVKNYRVFPASQLPDGASSYFSLVTCKDPWTVHGCTMGNWYRYGVVNGRVVFLEFDSWQIPE